MAYPPEDRDGDVSDSLDSVGPVSVADPDDSDDGGSDAEQIMSALHVPPPDATIPELRKTLALCQKSLTEARAKLKLTTKELRTIQAALPPKKRRGIANKSVSLDEDIGRVAKKFSMLHRLWVIEGLFPIKNSLNPDADLFDKKRWDSADTKRIAVLTELFRITPEHLYKEMVKYKPFGSVFTSVLNQERSNMLRVVKEASTLVFAPLKIPDPTIFTSPARKKDDPEMIRLSMNHGVYSSAAPILYEDPDRTDNDAGFLKNPVLVNVLRLLIFGRNALTKEKARGGPKARGKIHGIQSVTEGLIALAAIFVRFMLSPDPELQSTGNVSKIPYEVDYDFYLRCLCKRSRWSIDTIDFFNTEVFGNKRGQNPGEQTAPSAPARSWEDDFLDKLDKSGPDEPMLSSSGIGDSAVGQPSSGPFQSYSPAHHSYHQPLVHPPPRPYLPSPSSATHSSPSARPLPSPHLNAPQENFSNCVDMVSIHNHSGANLSSISRLQVEVGQMSISSTPNPRLEPVNAQTALTSGSRRISSARHVPVPVHVLESSVPAADSEPLVVQKRTTRSRAKNTGKK